MLKRTIFIQIIILFLAITPVTSQTLEELSVSVAYLRSANKYGTGFFVAGPKNYYLVTAAHVSHFINEKSTITIREENDKPYTFPISGIIGNNGIPKWVQNEKQDIAILKLDMSIMRSKFEGRMLALERLEPKLVPPKRERHLVVMGFPLSLGSTGYFSPITSICKAASGLLSIKTTNGDERISYVVDKPSIEGYSGGPVFLMPWPFSDSPALRMINFGSEESKVKCVGVAVATINDKTGGKLGQIIPSHFVSAMIKQADAN